MMNTLQFQKKLLGMQGNMMNFALILTSNKDDARDLTQDTTLKVLDNQEKFTDNINFKGWVLTVMRNIFINNYHKIVRAQTVIDRGIDVYNLELMTEFSNDTPEGYYKRQEIMFAIDQLNHDLKTPFNLYINGYKYNEIALKLNLPLGTVKSRIFFARKELQEELKDFHEN